MVIREIQVSIYTQGSSTAQKQLIGFFIPPMFKDGAALESCCNTVCQPKEKRAQEYLAFTGGSGLGLSWLQDGLILLFVQGVRMTGFQTGYNSAISRFFCISKE